MIPEKYLQELGKIRARFIEQILEKCNEPSMQPTPLGDLVIHDGPIKIGTVKLETEKTDTGITFRYILVKP